MVLVKPRIWPDTTDTAPNSPIARACTTAPRKAAPFDVRQGHLQEGLEPRGAERQGHFLIAGALLHQRNELRATNGKVTNMVASTIPAPRR